MKRGIVLILFLATILLSPILNANNNITFKLEEKVLVKIGGQVVLESPGEGLWSVATNWKNDWMCDWIHAVPSSREEVGDWTILKGEMDIHGGKMLVQDSYKEIEKGLIKVVRRYHWTGKDTLRRATLSVRFQLRGNEMKPFLPGILYYGNPSGARINAERVPVYTGAPGDFAIFEDHRFPMPFAMLENIGDKYGAAIHSTPSPVKGAVVFDQWWSMGVEASENYSELVLYSGPIGYNGQRSVAKSLQRKPMKYADTYLNIEPGRVIEKEFYIEVFPIEKQGTGFQKPIYTSLNLHQPYDVDRFPTYDEILKSKMSFTDSRWIEEDNGVGFGMYDLSLRKEVVMGWCGQADSPGYYLQWIRKFSDEKEIDRKVQKSMDFLTNYPIGEDGMFNVRYSLSTDKFSSQDHVSCGQAMYNFAKAIESARKNKRYNIVKWEEFLKEICDKQSVRILDDNWSPKSTAEGFYIAPLIIASELFNNKLYQKAAIKAGTTFADRHLSMEEPYWGGTLDATCEDKEGAWAAFQGFLELYERLGTDKYLVWAKHALDVCLSYVVVWDIPFQAGRLADHFFKSTGWTVVSPQNQHIDVYGVLFAPEVYKMGLHLENEDLKKLSKVMYRSCFQLTNAKGSQGEQLQQTNFAQQGDMSDVYKLRGGYSENWTVFWITAHFLNAAARFEEIGVTL